MNSVNPALNRSLIGILSLCAGVFVFSMQDAILKGLSGTHAVTLAIVLRSIIGLPLLLATRTTSSSPRLVAPLTLPVLPAHSQ